MSDQIMSFESFAVSHTGRVRSLNEDRYLMDPPSGVWVVADGMGGHDAGELASSAIVEHLATLGKASSAPDLRARFEDRIVRANAEIWRLSQSRGGATIGSTVAALLAYERQFACIWAGDSRVYLVRGGVLHQISRDHTEVQELVDNGTITEAEAIAWPRKNVITRAVGVGEDLVTDIELGYTEPNDVFVLSTDGLTGHVSDAEILEAVVSAAPEKACQELLQIVLERGATDNVTIVIVRCHETTAIDADERTFVRSMGHEVKYVW